MLVILTIFMVHQLYDLILQGGKAR